MKNGSVKAKKPATMRDVARLAGVSQPTVSRVLNSSETAIPVSDETRERVMWAISELGYRPNVLARSLRTQKTQMIALLIADIANGFYHEIARAVQDVARKHDYDVLIANSDHLYESERHFLEAVTRRPVDGVIMIPIHLTNEELAQFIERANTPVSVLAEYVTVPDIDVVYVRDENAVYETVRWMIDERGYRQIGYVGVPPDLPPGPRRLRGFTRAMHDAGLPIDPTFMLEGDFTVEGGARVMQSLIERGRLPEALLVCNDLMAIGAMLTVQDAGYRVPEDIAIIGFDDIPEATIVRPTLTTIAQDPRDIGTKLAEALFDRIENDAPVQRRVMESGYKLVIRNSG